MMKKFSGDCKFGLVQLLGNGEAKKGSLLSNLLKQKIQRQFRFVTEKLRVGKMLHSATEVIENFKNIVVKSCEASVALAIRQDFAYAKLS